MTPTSRRREMPRVSRFVPRQALPRHDVGGAGRGRAGSQGSAVTGTCSAGRRGDLDGPTARVSASEWGRGAAGQRGQLAAAVNNCRSLVLRVVGRKQPQLPGRRAPFEAARRRADPRGVGSICFHAIFIRPVLHRPVRRGGTIPSISVGSRFRLLLSMPRTSLKAAGGGPCRDDWFCCSRFGWSRALAGDNAGLSSRSPSAQQRAPVIRPILPQSRRSSRSCAAPATARTGCGPAR